MFLLLFAEGDIALPSGQQAALGQGEGPGLKGRMMPELADQLISE